MTTLQGFTREQLSALFDYNAETGDIINKTRRGSRALPGGVVGTVDGKGYLHTFIGGRFIRLHRLAYFLATGDTPAALYHFGEYATLNYE